MVPFVILPINPSDFRVFDVWLPKELLPEIRVNDNVPRPNPLRGVTLPPNSTVESNSSVIGDGILTGSRWSSILNVLGVPQHEYLVEWSCFKRYGNSNQ